MCLSAAGRVLEVDHERSEALVELRGVPRRVSLVMLSLDGQTITAGDWLVVSVGLALERITEAEARQYDPWLEPDVPSIP
jgi:hydrogenase assembly chaperone HypC/HupF